MNRMINWITVRDYESAKQEATDQIIRRQSRGNIFSPNGWAMSSRQLEENSVQADSDIEYLERRLKATA